MHRFVKRSDEHVILLDRSGQPSGTHPKRSVHGPNTPLHLGFSCHLTDGRGRVLLTQRAASKASWPDTWTNACCGHPLPGETLRAAVLRRLQHELGVSADGIGLAIADFTYRSEMPNGTVEHEVCPVVVAHVEGEPNLNPDEVTAAHWVEWDTLRTRAAQRPHSLSPWSVGQIAELDQLSPSPRVWLADFPSVGLDSPLGTPGVAVHPCSPSESFDPAHRPVEEILGAYLDERTSELAAIDPNLVAVAEEVAGLIAAGGKRLRPAFVYWGHRATGAGHDASVYYVAAAVEMLHTFALLHDDVMDRAATRRGRPTAQRSFAEVHRADGLAGDATWFGTSAAILAGDLAFVWADDLLERAGLTATALSRVRGVFTTLRTEVMAGQYLDLRLDGLAGADVASARRVALLKSGRYTVTRPLALGRTIACDHDTDTADALRVYGDALGLAFQMRDDVLGLLGDPAVTGKSSMSDLREGKRTVLALRALALATTSERAVLERALGDPELDDADAERCREIITSSGALASVETLIRTQHAAAIAAVAGLPQPARNALRSLASTVVRRAM